MELKKGQPTAYETIETGALGTDSVSRHRGMRNSGTWILKEEAEAFLYRSKTDEIPAEVLEIIEKQKAQEFQMTYQSEDYLYIMKGYGLQEFRRVQHQGAESGAERGGIVCETQLVGPSTREEMSKEVSYPYIVLKTEYRDLPFFSADGPS